MVTLIVVVAAMWIVAHVLARIEDDAAIRAEVERIRGKIQW